MRNGLLKVEKTILRIGGVVTALLAIISLWQVFWSPQDPAPAETIIRTTVTACDAGAEPVADGLMGSLARLDCDVADIRVCDFTETATPADRTTTGMPAHMMRVSAEIDGERLAVIGNGRGADAAQTAFDSLYNNLIQILEDKDICRSDRP